MCLTVNISDPRSTTAAALVLAGELAPLLRGPVPVLLDRSTSDDLAALAARMEREAIFDRAMRTDLRDLIAEIEAVTERETRQQVDWVPVRCIDGAEEFEPIVRHERSRHGDALAKVGERLGLLLAFVERTEALLVAERLLRRRRH
jgi:hypothetical protein